MRDNICKCQIANQYWGSNLAKCLTYRNYTDLCDADYLCNINQMNLTCYAASTCSCPTPVAANACDCPPDQYFDTINLGNKCKKLNRLNVLKSNLFKKI